LLVYQGAFDEAAAAVGQAAALICAMIWK
jgi:hypothetical protein